MANRHKQGFGLTAELQRKNAAKWDQALASECLQWLHAVLTCKDDPRLAELAATIKLDALEMDDIMNLLKDGRILCEVLNVLRPGTVARINQQSAKFKIMENVNNFTKGCIDHLKCVPSDLFQSVDLCEGNNMVSVVDGIQAFGRKARSLCEEIGAPLYGPAESTENKREFTQEQQDAGKNVIGLQMGSNKGASQAGQNFGKTRAIID